MYNITTVSAKVHGIYRNAQIFILSNLVLFLFSFCSFGQIPNSGFENWNNVGSYMDPDGWWNPNDSATTGYYPITKSADHYPSAVGIYSLRMENNISILPDWGAIGVAWTGGWNGNNYPAFPLIGHPTSLWGYYKFLPQGGDTMEIHIRLYQNGIDVGGGQFKNPATVSSWSPFMVPFSGYVSADSARIMILSCYDNDAPVPHGNSVLYIDNLSFDSLISDGISESLIQEGIHLYPNPVSRLLNVSLSGNETGKVLLTINDVMGKKVKIQRISNGEKSVSLDVSDLPEGIYGISITEGNQAVYKDKLIVCR